MPERFVLALPSGLQLLDAPTELFCRTSEVLQGDHRGPTSNFVPSSSDGHRRCGTGRVSLYPAEVFAHSGHTASKKLLGEFHPISKPCLGQQDSAVNFGQD